MSHTFSAAFVLAAALVVTTSVAAQSGSPAPGASPQLRQWDASGFLGWHRGNKSELAPDYNDWYEAVALGVSAGYYFTPHLKVEGDVGTTSAGEIYLGTGLVSPYYPIREHRFRSTTVGAHLAYQFLENRWVHPFVSGGVTLTHESNRADALAANRFARDLRNFGEPFPTLPSIDESSTHARPSFGAGLKAYVAERAFIRTDARATISGGDARTFVWRGGAGFDF